MKPPRQLTIDSLTAMLTYLEMDTSILQKIAVLKSADEASRIQSLFRENIKTARRRLNLLYHPDRNKAPAKSVQEINALLDLLSGIQIKYNLFCHLRSQYIHTRWYEYYASSYSDTTTTTGS